MLNEPASSIDKTPTTSAPRIPISEWNKDESDEIRELVSTVLLVDTELHPATDPIPIDESLILMGRGTRLIATFAGRLMVDSETAYSQLDNLLQSKNWVAMFREMDGKQVIHVLTRPAKPKPRGWWINLVLLVATTLSLLLVGTAIAIAEIKLTDPGRAKMLTENFLGEIWRGWPYAVSLLLILGTHELGHYFAARRHKMMVSLPYFIPLPFLSPFGTLGAFIQLRQPIRNRKILLDIGVSGPLAGLVFAIPILLIGLANITPLPIAAFGDPGDSSYEGDSIVYALAKTVTYGHFVPDGQVDICVDCSQLAWAGWTGLLVTAFNLFPLGQLDGGHIMYSLFGDRARKLYFPTIVIMLLLTLFVSSIWWLWLLLLVFLGRVYATPLDNLTPLNPGRRIVAIFALIVFVLIFVPAPLTQTGGNGLFTGALALTAAPAIIRSLIVRARLWQLSRS
jgi:membrane-associated protease RseP (regulator of RpoE activity)